MHLECDGNRQCLHDGKRQDHQQVGRVGSSHLRSIRDWLLFTERVPTPPARDMNGDGAINSIYDVGLDVTWSRSADMNGACSCSDTGGQAN